MSLDTNTLQRTDSPVRSGRTSPAHQRLRNADDDGFLKKDKGYRRYASGVERVLSSFDTSVEEWADYISFLGRLLKALQSKPAGTVEIPHRTLVAKRLSQCLNPVLPAGVHQKTLDVYAYIFAALGSEDLSKNLSLYLPGLTPILSFAALSVKPAALTLFETYIVALTSISLRPALKAIILALLPCLEEESTEEFERTLRILAALKEAIGRGLQPGHDSDTSGDQYFWQCLFLACITSKSRRPGALAYLARNLPRLGEPSIATSAGSQQNGDSGFAAGGSTIESAIRAVASPEPGLLVRCFCAGLRDEQVLIQRGFLDLLVSHLPLHSTVLQHKVVSDDLQRLISAASSVVARRDMSLNRRLWSWFLGPDSAENTNGSAVTANQDGFGYQGRYFEQYGLEHLVRTIRKMIDCEPQNPADRARPFRICLSLMDRWEIGGLVVPAVFLPAMRSVWQYQLRDRSPEATSEVLRSAKMFFDGVESGLIWAEIIKVIIHVFDPQEGSSRSACDGLKLLLFIVTNFNVKEEEMLVVHMPIASYALLLRVRMFLQRVNKPQGPDEAEMVLLALKITSRLLDLAPQRAFASECAVKTDDDIEDGDEYSLHDDELQLKIQHFYTNNQGNLDFENPPLSPKVLGQALLQSSVQLAAILIRSGSLVPFGSTDAALNVLNLALRKVSKIAKPDLDQFLANLLDVSLGNHSDGSPKSPFPIIAAKVSALEAIGGTPQSASWIPSSYVRQLIPRLLAGLWPNLSPSMPQHNVEAARCMWRLQSISTDKRLLESTISTLLISDGSDDELNPIRLEDAQRFATLWAHLPNTTASQSRRSSLMRSATESNLESSAGTDLHLLERPLMLLLDILDTPKSPLFIFVVSWLQSLPSLRFITSLVIDRLSGASTVALTQPEPFTHIRQFPDCAKGEPDSQDLCCYYLQLTLTIVQCSPKNMWPALEGFSPSDGDSRSPENNAIFLARICLRFLAHRPNGKDRQNDVDLQLKQAALIILRHLLEGPISRSIIELELDIPLLEGLISSVQLAQYQLQLSVMDVLLVALRMRLATGDVDPIPHQRPVSRDTIRGSSALSISTDGDDRKSQQRSPTLPPRLLHCLTLGLTSRNSRPVLDGWITFLHQCLPLYMDNIFQIIIPLVECFCNTLNSAFKSMQATFGKADNSNTDTLEPTLALLLNGLEQSLATAHDRLMTDEVSSTPIKSPEQQQQGFFGNMVSGVFSVETNRSRTLTANNRLTVLLCFKDAVRVCFAIWSWGDQGMSASLPDNSTSASYKYTILRLRNRTRRIFEHLFAAEALECLETLVELWQNLAKERGVTRNIVLNLLQVLDGSRPKNAIPAMFNAIYSRTNPGALDPVRKSTLSSNLTDVSLAAFLVAYTKSLDDDAMDEIWNDCMTFLKDVLANPMPHRQTLPRLLEFTAVLGEKVDNTNFGEQRKMRRELGDLFIRLLTATLTIRPMGFSFEAPAVSSIEGLAVEGANARKPTDTRGTTGSEGLISVLAAIAPNISKVLIDPDRITSMATMISTQIIAPIFRSKTFPENITECTLELMIALGSIPEANRTWKRDVSEAFNDSKFFSSPLDLAQQKWLPVIRQWSLADKDRMPELLSRLTSPTSAGIMFGVGASSARLEADRKAQLNFRRIAFLILTTANDTFVVNMATLQEKVVDLLSASAASSPSSTTRAEIYMVIRALILKTSAPHLASFWPTINAELYDAISSAFPGHSTDIYSVGCLLQACKLLDTLLTLGLDDFQMQEWLFITDTTDSVYRASNSKPVAMIDELAEELDSGPDASYFADSSTTSLPHGFKRKPLLTSTATKDVPNDEMMEKVLRPFFRQLSIHDFESTYSMDAPDWSACFDELMADIFNYTTLV
ncbi:hypothetical protein MMC30_007968 [Trapelia coarctata]|nr:hypothetical protein [Trapelia coarctata]